RVAKLRRTEDRRGDRLIELAADEPVALPDHFRWNFAQLGELDKQLLIERQIELRFDKQAGLGKNVNQDGCRFAVSRHTAGVQSEQQAFGSPLAGVRLSRC